MIPSTIRRPGARAGVVPRADVLTDKFLDIDAPERRTDPHTAAQQVCADYAQRLRSERQPRPRVWAKRFVVIGLATAVVWSWLDVVRSPW